MKKLLFLLLFAVVANQNFADVYASRDGIRYKIITEKKYAFVTYTWGVNGYNTGGPILRKAVIKDTIQYNGEIYNVTSIGNDAFHNCTELTSVTIGSKVTTIGVEAFKDCIQLKSISIPTNVTQINTEAFSGSGLSSITILGKKVKIADAAFQNCESLKTVSINAKNIVETEYADYSPTGLRKIFGLQVEEYILGDDIVSIGNKAFYNCKNLKSITIPNSVTNIKYFAFGYCEALRSITLPNSVTELGEGVFSNCSALTAIDIPQRIKSIGGYTFSYCKSLKSVVIPDNIKSIGLHAFKECTGMTSVTIGKGVDSIASWTFYGCSNLTTVTCKGRTPAKLEGEKHFYNHANAFAIYVCENSLDAYKTAWADYANHFAGTQCAEEYTISFVNWDGTILQSSLIDKGDLPVYYGDTPVRPAEAQYTYTFSGWSPNISVASRNATYVATFQSAIRQYEISFVNGEEVLQKRKLDYGTVPEYYGQTPTKPDDAQYSYTFRGWSPQITVVTQDAIYSAVFDSKIRTYTITFMDGDQVLQSTEVEYGAMPQYNGNEPSKPADAQYSYTFAGWSPQISAVTGNATYVATYTKTLQKYTITWKDDDASIIDQTIHEYGQMPTHANPTKQATKEYVYTFDSWQPAIVAVTTDATYTATYKSDLRTYIVSFVDWENKLIDEQSVQYGHAATAPQVPERKGYNFVGWDKDFSNIQSDLIVTALYEEVPQAVDNAFIPVAPHKILRDGKFFILRDGKTYTVQGQEVR